MIYNLLNIFVFCFALFLIEFFVPKSGNVSSSYPEYNADRFSFCRYRIRDGSLEKILPKIFTEGTPKSFVDKALVDVAGAEPGLYRDGRSEIDGSVLYRQISYRPPNNICNPYIKNPPHYKFIFDPNHNLIRIETQIDRPLHFE